MAVLNLQNLISAIKNPLHCFLYYFMSLTAALQDMDGLRERALEESHM
uniref:Uncharacterized protein n=1 Tax=Trichinella nativa TaxID=6335 RepID=A0A0V1KIJ1_9BILA